MVVLGLLNDTKHIHAYTNFDRISVTQFFTINFCARKTTSLSVVWFYFANFHFFQTKKITWKWVQLMWIVAEHSLSSSETNVKSETNEL